MILLNSSSAAGGNSPQPSGRQDLEMGGIKTQVGNHTARAIGINIYLLNGGTLEKAQQTGAYESPRTTKLYERTYDAVSEGILSGF